MKMKDCVIGEMYMINTAGVSDYNLRSLGESRIYILQYEGLNSDPPDFTGKPYRFKIVMGTCGRELKPSLAKYSWGPGDTINFNGGERVHLKAL
jgi:hypothetical protein